MSKLFEFQKKVGAIKKDSVNPYYKSKYADINSLLDVVKPVLNEIGLTVVQPLEVRDNKSVLVTKIFDDDKLVLESSIIIPDNNDPQKMGSAITYYRRYSLQSMLLLEAEDDDAESVKPQKKESSPIKQELKHIEKLVELNQDIVDKINRAKTETELKNIWIEIADAEQPKYAKMVSIRKSILKANKTT